MSAMFQDIGFSGYYPGSCIYFNSGSMSIQFKHTEYNQALGTYAAYTAVVQDFPGASIDFSTYTDRDYNDVQLAVGGHPLEYWMAKNACRHNITGSIPETSHTLGTDTYLAVLPSFTN